MENTSYKIDVKPSSTTIWFHEGNGHNFKVKKTKKYLYVTRYHTNGYTNIDINTHKLVNAKLPTTWDEARILWDEAKIFKSTTTKEE